VESNAAFRDDSLTPVFAGNVPDSIYPLLAKTAGQQRIVLEACYERDLEKAFVAFANDNLVRLSVADARSKYAAQYIDEVAGALCAAKAGMIDDVIEPAKTRAMIISALEMLASKRDSNPPKKHGNVPM
jgi:acetyl-CoA carboxylase carboxyltransferase component